MRRCRTGWNSAVLLVGALCLAGCRSDGTMPWSNTAQSQHPRNLADPIAPESGVIWMTDIDLALDRAAAENRRLLVVFTGSDWCVWCQRLHEEVFTSSDFRDWIHEQSLLCVVIDFPRQTQQPAAIEQRNQELLQAYGGFVTAYPTVLILDRSGSVLAKLGYVPGGPTTWIDKANRVMQAGQATVPRR